MTDQIRVVEALATAAGRGEPVVLASVVATEGSAYRRVGARMVVRADGTLAGLVSAGCLEDDLTLQAARALAQGDPTLVRYDTRGDDDLAWGLGCNGVVDVLLEPLQPARAGELGAFLARAMDRDAPCTLLTVLSASGPGAPRVGARAAVGAGRLDADGDWGTGDAYAAAVATALDALAPARGEVREYALLDLNAALTHVRVSAELVLPRVRLVVCGSGPDAEPVVRLATSLGWSVTVVDHRPTVHARPERFAPARVAECASASRLGDSVRLTPGTSAVVMSHHYERDLDYLESLLAAGVRYAGVLGPRARTNRILAEIAARGAVDLDAACAAVHGPAGLDIGGDGPEAIALAIVAEVQASAHLRSAAPLRGREAPIHEDVGRAAANGSIRAGEPLPMTPRTAG